MSSDRLGWKPFRSTLDFAKACFGGCRGLRRATSRDVVGVAESPAGYSLLDLTPELLWTIASAAGDKAALRITCRSLRQGRMIGLVGTQPGEGTPIFIVSQARKGMIDKQSAGGRTPLSVGG